MVYGLVKSMRANPDRGPAQVVLANGYCTERSIPGLAAHRENVFFVNGVVMQFVLGDIVLGIYNIL